MSPQNLPYDGAQTTENEIPDMPPRIPIKPINGESFGARLARFRREAGFAQAELASEIGISQRMVAYYEKQTDYPPTHLLPAWTRALGVSADVLLGLKKPGPRSGARDNRLARRLRQLEKLPPGERRQLVAILDKWIGNGAAAR